MRGARRPSGAGKSSILKIVFGNYLAAGGHIRLADDERYLDIERLAREIIAARRRIMGYVSQFLRVIPRVSARDIVAAAARDAGLDAERAREARGKFARAAQPARTLVVAAAGDLFRRRTATRQHRARLRGRTSLLILDEPTASLDERNREAVVELIAERRARGAGFLTIFHDEDVRQRVADRIIDVVGFPRARPHDANLASATKR